MKQGDELCPLQFNKCLKANMYGGGKGDPILEWTLKFKIWVVILLLSFLLLRAGY